MDLVKRICQHMGITKSELAVRLGVTKGAVSQWPPIPFQHAIPIERMTNGAFRCEEIYPDADWTYLRTTDCPVTPEQEKKAA